MALQEIERKLADSVDGLRVENKTLIELLKLRQHQLKDSLVDSSSSKLQNVTSQSELLNTLYSRAQRTLRKGNSSGTSSADIKAQSKTGGNIFVLKTRPQCSKVLESNHRTARAKLAEHSKAKNEGDELYYTTKEKSHYSRDVDFSSEDETNEDGSYNTPDTSLMKMSSARMLDPIPRSILKRRKIIDDNVHVESKYQHTPSGTPKSQKKLGLNYSYSDVDDSDLDQQYSHLPTNTRRNTELNYPSSDYDSDTQLKYLQQKKNQRKIDGSIREIEHVMTQRLLDDPGNDRQHASIVRSIEKRPKNVLFDVNEKEPLDETLKSMDTSKDTSDTLSCSWKDLTTRSSMNPSREGRPLLGYDWIAGVLENEGLFEESEKLFNEVEEFRRANREDCVGTANVWDKSLDLRRPVSPEIEDPGHACIHGFTVNERLFTEPVNLNEEGNSVCPVCMISRKPPTKEDPAFVRVSIPRSSIAAPYKVIPHTRKSFDPTDSYALSQHCLAGWQNAKPATLPTASTLDIKDKVIPKETTSYDEARKVAESFSRMGHLLNGKDLPEDRLAKELLNRSHCLRYELEVMKDTFNQSGAFNDLSK